MTVVSKPIETNIVYIPLDRITSKLPVRRLSAAGIARLRESIRRSGFLDNFPLIVLLLEDGNYLLIEGNHRYEAAKEEGLAAVPCIVKSGLTEQEQFKLALQSNNAAETIVPSTMVTNAEFIWARLADKKYTQAEVGQMLGWSRESVKDYAALQKIDHGAWDIIGATFEKVAPSGENDVAPFNGATAPFSERLLRSILPLRPKQQRELVQALSHPDEKKRITKGKFNALAEAYKSRNESKLYAFEQLGAIGYSFLSEVCREIDKGSYDKDWLDTTEHPKLHKLIESIREEWERKNSLRLIHGDFYEEVTKVGAGSIDLILTDPPYNIARENEFELEGRANISQDFGEWDKYEHQSFIDLFTLWAREWARILREQGSGYIFTSDTYISHLRSALESAGLHVKATIIWHKTNPGTQVVKTNFRSSIEYILFFTKGQGGHTFNWQGENEMHNFIESAICSGNERLTDAKGNTLHPTQKPEKVLRHFTEISSNRGDTVFDGFMGVGSTGKVAKGLGRKFIGIEQDKLFFEATQRRLAE